MASSEGVSVFGCCESVVVINVFGVMVLSRLVVVVVVMVVLEVVMVKVVVVVVGEWW